jgi:ppGpp synthetase/RelA/SpoT-type nucleotidyltranferase|tara:strand:- start:182 stop:493 length:312 start_codon:yes stop_codon:yes gene_type:complete
MATTKVKGTSTKIKELKGIKPEKVSKEHLKEIQEIVNSVNRAQLEIGTLEVKKHELLHAIAGFREKLTNIQEELEKEYGTYDVNITDGTINYPKENGEVNKED